MIQDSMKATSNNQASAPLLIFHNLEVFYCIYFAFYSKKINFIYEKIEIIVNEGVYANLFFLDILKLKN